MNTKSRDIQIKKSNLKTIELARKYGISYERVRQILRNDNEKKYQKFIKTAYEYRKNVCKLIESDIHKEAYRLSNKGRNKFIIVQKVIFINILKNKYKMSLYRIAKLLNNNYGTIFHLYKNYNIYEKLKK